MQLLWSNSSSEKVTVVSNSLFWRSSCSEEVLTSLKKKLLRKCSCPEKVTIYVRRSIVIWKSIRLSLYLKFMASNNFVFSGLLYSMPLVRSLLYRLQQNGLVTRVIWSKHDLVSTFASLKYKFRNVFFCVFSFYETGKVRFR